MKNTRINMSRAGVFIAPGREPWPHERRIANVFANMGHFVEFLPESHIHTADIRIDGIEYEIKSPKSASINSLEHTIKRALKQSQNIIIDSYRLKNVRDDKMCNFLKAQIKSRKRIKKMLYVTKTGEIIDIFNFI